MSQTAEYVKEVGRRAKAAARVFGQCGAARRDKALLAIADALEEGVEEILQANAQDLEAADQNGMRDSLKDRLRLTPQRVASIAEAVRQVVALPDPVGEIDMGTVRPNGLRIQRVRVPLGVVGIIFEARPNVTVDAAALCLKSGNACILRGGKEAIHSNLLLARLMRGALARCGLPEDTIQLISDTSRESANAMMDLRGYLDVLIPRGGAGLIRAVAENAHVPVIETGVGNCHVYVDATVDLEMAVNIIDNAKNQRPSVCNAAETLLVHKDIAGQFLPLAQAKLQEHSTQLRCDPAGCAILPQSTPATEEDWATEYGDYILAVRVVESLDQALEHIARYSTGHSEAIVTCDYNAAQRFLNEVDAAAVYVNASTRFTDGGEFGFGAEIGISTQKLHARGPMGLRELTTVKYMIYGDGQIR